MSTDPLYKMALILVTVLGAPVSFCQSQDTARVHVPYPEITDLRYKEACGPIACVCALTSLGIETSLKSCASGCGWSNGHSVPFKNIVSHLSSDRRIRVHLTRLSANTLESYLSKPGTAAILPVRKRSEEVNHVICVLGERTGGLRCVDYPGLDQVIAAEELRGIWDGEALLIELKSSIDVVNGLLAGALIVQGAAIGAFLIHRNRRIRQINQD